MTLDEQRVVKVLQAIPVVALAKRAEAATALADYLGGLADWVRVRCEGPLKGREDRFPFDLGRQLGMAIGRLAFAWPDPLPADPIWRPLTRFTEREYAIDLMGEVLQGMTEALVTSGGPPDARFWAAWDPASSILPPLRRQDASFGRRPRLGLNSAARWGGGTPAANSNDQGPNCYLRANLANRHLESGPAPQTKKLPTIQLNLQQNPQPSAHATQHRGRQT